MIVALAHGGVELAPQSGKPRRGSGGLKRGSVMRRERSWREMPYEMVVITIPNQSSVAKAFTEFDETRRMKPSAFYEHVIPRVPVRQWVLSLPIPLRLLLAAQPKLVTPVLQVVHRMITRFLLDQAGLKAEQADSGAVTLIQRFGSAANLNIHLHCLVLDGPSRGTRSGRTRRGRHPRPRSAAGAPARPHRQRRR